MKALIILGMTISSFQIFSATTSKDLLNNETQLAIKMANKYAVPLEVKGVCTKTKFEVLNTTKSYNPSKWFLISGKNSYVLNEEEIQGMIELANRIEVPLVQKDSINTELKFDIQGSSCGFTPYRWKASFDISN